MPATLSSTTSEILTILNKVNADIISEYHQYMRDKILIVVEDFICMVTQRYTRLCAFHAFSLGSSTFDINGNRVCYPLSTGG